MLPIDIFIRTAVLQVLFGFLCTGLCFGSSAAHGACLARDSHRCLLHVCGTIARYGNAVTKNMAFMAFDFHCSVPKVFPQDVVKCMQTPFGSGAPVQCFYPCAFTRSWQGELVSESHNPHSYPKKLYRAKRVVHSEIPCYQWELPFRFHLSGF